MSKLDVTSSMIGRCRDTDENQPIKKLRSPFIDLVCLGWVRVVQIYVILRYLL
jgi:hypothetical protein